MPFCQFNRATTNFSVFAAEVICVIFVLFNRRFVSKFERMSFDEEFVYATKTHGNDCHQSIEQLQLRTFNIDLNHHVIIV